MEILEAQERLQPEDAMTLFTYDPEGRRIHRCQHTRRGRLRAQPLIHRKGHALTAATRESGASGFRHPCHVVVRATSVPMLRPGAGVDFGFAKRAPRALDQLVSRIGCLIR